MEELETLDIPETPAIRGRISRGWRLVCHSRRNRREVQAGARRRLRRAVRQALHKGNARDIPEPITAWYVS